MPGFSFSQKPEKNEQKNKTGCLFSLLFKNVHGRISHVEKI